MLALGADEVIVVDYGCPGGTGAWVAANHPEAKVVKVSDDPGFSTARARNIGGANARSDWLAFVDGDVLTEPGWGAWMREQLAPGHFYIAAAAGRQRDPETYGTFICARKDFARAGGYDEVFRGWGGEDLDLFRRLSAGIAAPLDYPAEFVRAIRHGDEERGGLVGGKAQRSLVTTCYTEAKLQIAGHMEPGKTLPLKFRQALMARTDGKLRRWFASGASQPLTLRYALGGGKRLSPLPYAIDAEITFTIRVRQLDEAEIDPDDPFQVSVE